MCRHKGYSVPPVFTSQHGTFLIRLPGVCSGCVQSRQGGLRLHRLHDCGVARLHLLASPVSTRLPIPMPSQLSNGKPGTMASQGSQCICLDVPSQWPIGSALAADGRTASAAADALNPQSGLAAGSSGAGRAFEKARPGTDAETKPSRCQGLEQLGLGSSWRQGSAGPHPST